MKIGRIVCLCLLLVSSFALFLPGSVFAQEEEKIELEPTYGKLEATAPGASFEFEVALKFQGSEPREFDLSASGPKDWSVYVKPSYGEQRIGSIRLEPGKAYGDKVKIAASPPFFITPEPGEYKVTLEASSGDISGSVDLTAVITATYSLKVAPTTERYNTKATAGKDNVFSIEIQNTGSASLENIKLSSRKPNGWTIDFTPKEIGDLSPGSSQTIDVNIKPAPKAIAGDYQITLTSDAKQTKESIDIRVTVETPTIWGWVGVGIILVVIAGVTAVFIRFSRR
jgi:uncharacterized membrane protein